MGQQQLLLTILVTIVVGVAVVVAINTMTGARTDANESAVRNDILKIINDAQRYYQEPAMLGGGGYSFDGISTNDILSINPENENGTYTISGSGDSVTVIGNGTFGNVQLEATATKTNDGMDVTWK